MAATVKCDTIVNASSATNNLALDTSGNVTVGAGLTVTGALTGSSTIAAATGTLYPIIVGTPSTIVNTSTSTTITGIPSWAKRVIVNGIGVTKAGFSTMQLLQIGPSGGVATSGYAATCFFTTSYVSNSTAGFPVTIIVNGTTAFSWMMTLNLVNASTNQWQISGTTYDNVNFYGYSSSGYVSLSGALSQVKLLSSGGDAFSAGSINVSYE